MTDERDMGARVVPQRSGASERLLARIAADEVLILDGALGTELERRGSHCALPLWSTHALLSEPDVVSAIHRDYVAAGADLLTANTFRTQRRTLGLGGIADQAAKLTELAVALAREAASQEAAERDVFVLGSAPPLEDCYRPDLVPDDEILDREHEEHAQNLAHARVDAILCETLNTIREARAAVRAAVHTGLPVLVSFICDGSGRLLGGEQLDAALAVAAEAGVRAVLVNCLPPSAVAPCLGALRAVGLPFGIYPNLGAPLAVGRSEERSPAQIAELAAQWRSAGASIVGGCCGTRPDHIRALRDVCART
jgi:S-methylmethionine-dependent homocysteine/selenocysteine methylase